MILILSLVFKINENQQHLLLFLPLNVAIVSLDPSEYAERLFISLLIFGLFY